VASTEIFQIFPEHAWFNKRRIATLAATITKTRPCQQQTTEIYTRVSRANIKKMTNLLDDLEI